MKDLKEKYSQWCEKVRCDDKRFYSIILEEGKMYFLTHKNTETVLSLNMALDRGSGIEKVNVYDYQTPPAEGKKFNIIIKEEEKLLIDDGKELISFGIKDTDSRGETIFIHMRTRDAHALIIGSKNASSIKMLFSEIIDNNDDAITQLVNKVFGSAESTVQKKEEQ